ncbi:hypothetical protein BDV19DRAFT_385304 [Aspergillus venezuelensis]
MATQAETKPTIEVKEGLSTITDDRLRPVPEIQSFTNGEASTSEILAALIRSGGMIICSAVAAEHLDQIERDTRPKLGDFMLPNNIDHFNDFFSAETKRVLGLAVKSKTFMEQIGDELQEWHSPPQLHNTIIFSVCLGAKDQALHRDNVILHNPCRCKKAEEYTLGQDASLGFFVAAKPSTKENGATRIIPGSHLWDNMTPPDDKLTVQAELNRGDAFMFLSSCFHGASANNTPDQERLLYSCFFTKSYLKQEENQHLATDLEKLMSMGYDDEILGDIGCRVSEPYMGYCDCKDPLTWMRENSNV